jgi:hypothetical protein
MRKIEPGEIKNILEYEKVRGAAKARNLEVTRHRRVPVGDQLSLLFENRETVWFQIQEMVRTERIVDERKVQDEIDTYNGLIPDAGELSATLFIEIPEIARLPPQEVRRRVDGFLGLRNGCIVLELGEERVAARFEGGGSQEERMSAVQFMRFALPAAARAALPDPSRPAALAVDHPNYRARATLSAETRAALGADLADG